MSIVIDVADAIVSDLKTAGPTLGLHFDVERRRFIFDGWIELGECKTQVSVIPSRVRVEQDDRNGLQHQVSCDIYIRRRFEPEFLTTTGDIEEDELKRCDDFCENVYRLFMPGGSLNGRLTDLEAAVWFSDQRDNATEFVPYVHEHLNERQQYTSIVRLTFLVPD